MFTLGNEVREKMKDIAITATFGHIIDGNMHINIIVPEK